MCRQASPPRTPAGCTGCCTSQWPCWSSPARAGMARHSSNSAGLRQCSTQQRRGTQPAEQQNCRSQSLALLHHLCLSLPYRRSTCQTAGVRVRRGCALVKCTCCNAQRGRRRALTIEARRPPLNDAPERAEADATAQAPASATKTEASRMVATGTPARCLVTKCSALGKLAALCAAARIPRSRGPKCKGRHVRMSVYEWICA